MVGLVDVHDEMWDLVQEIHDMQIALLAEGDVVPELEYIRNKMIRILEG